MIVLFDAISGSRSFIFIRNGKVLGDYFLLEKKPKILGVILDQESAAIISNQQGDYRVCRSGVNIFHKPVAIACAVSIVPTQIRFGPENKDSLRGKKSVERDSDYHQRINLAKITKAVSMDGVVVYPKIKAFFKITAKNEKGLVKLFESLKDFQGKRAIESSSQFFNEVFCNLILREFRRFISSRSIKQLTNELPCRIQSDTKLEGIEYLIYFQDFFTDEDK